jgi:thiol-disulfide isomerase/thioredoxin
MRLWVAIWLIVLLGLLSLSGASAETTLGYYTEITNLSTGCFPQGLKLEAEPIEGIEWPEAHEQALFGLFLLRDAIYPVMIDRHDDGFDLYVDSNLDGELLHFAWDRVLADGTSLASVSFVVPYSNEQTASYQAFLMWSGFTPTVLTYCRDSYRAGEIQLGEITYPLILFDEDTDARYDDLDDGTLIIDSDGDGRLLVTSDSHEVFSLGEPFNLNGTVYEVAAVAEDGSWIEIVESDADVAPKYPLLDGFPAPIFEGIDVLGEPLSSDSLKGDIIVLDFWASWCAPCIYELPTMESIVTDYADLGVRVIGINLDRTESAFQSALETYGIGYEQVYDSDRGPIGDLYRIEGIPMTYIIDREGIIAARGLRGEALVAAIQELLDREE